MVEKRILALSNKPPFLVQLHSCFQTMDRLYFVVSFESENSKFFSLQKLGTSEQSNYLLLIITLITKLQPDGIRKWRRSNVPDHAAWEI